MTKKNMRMKAVLRLLACAMALLLMLSVTACSAEELMGFLESLESVTETETKNEIPKAETPAEGEVRFHFIDVGQGDAILVTTAAGNMLVDTSIKGVREELKAYLDAVGVTELAYLVLTHPDADHIGNADYIIETYDIETVLLCGEVSTSKTYERMLTALENSKAEVVTPEPGYTFSLGGLQNIVLAPNDDYGDANEASIVIKSTFGSTSVMLTGDAEHKSEEDILKVWSAADLKCDILKAGHHGSSSSTTDEFLAAVAPTYVVISCGEGNTYGHPHQEILEKLENAGIKVLRTDLLGNIVFVSDGEKLTLIEK